MRVLVTGAAGFIGTNLIPELERHGHVAIGLDRKDGGWFRSGDLRMPGVMDSYLEAYVPDHVIHLAAQPGRLFGEDAPMKTVIANAGMTTLVAKSCGEHDVPLLYASTSEVYGDGSERTWAEDDLHISDPHNIYGMSKRWGEDACRLYAPKGLGILRLSMPFGPGVLPGRGRAAIINILDQARRRVEIPIHRGAERSWCWVGDTARGIRLILESGQEGAWNVGRDDDPVPMARVAEIACELTGAPTDLIKEIDAPGRQTVIKRLSTSKLAALGWKPSVTLREGMEMTLRWIEEASEIPPVSALPDAWRHY